MLAKLHTFSLLGIDALPVEVEVDVSPGALPKTVLVGMPEQAVKESTHRIERAMVNSGFVRPQDRVVINLAPAELPKSAGSFDLPIAVGILAGSGRSKASCSISTRSLASSRSTAVRGPSEAPSR
jgi:magnesium chelatase family protein